MAGREVATTILDLISAQNAGWKKRNSCSLMLSQRNKEELPRMVSANLCLNLRTPELSRLLTANLVTDKGHGIACGLSEAWVGLTFLSHIKLWAQLDT